MRCRPIVLSLVLLALTHLVSGCLALGLNPFYDPAAIATDDRVLGSWNDPDDQVTVTIEQSDWRSYRITYAHPIEKGVLTGYVIAAGNVVLLDLAIARGEDLGSFVVPAHALVRLGFSGSALSVSPLSFDRLANAFESRQLPPSLGASMTERRQLVLSGTPSALHRWAITHAHDESTFGPAYMFRRMH